MKYHYSGSATYQANNERLSELIKEAKETGQETNKKRQEVNRLRGEREHIIRQIAANQAAGFDVSELETREANIRKDMEKTKNDYNEIVKRLKQLKPNIDHLQHMRERARIDMHREFDDWFQKQATSRPKSSSSRQSTPEISNGLQKHRSNFVFQAALL